MCSNRTLVASGNSIVIVGHRKALPFRYLIFQQSSAQLYTGDKQDSILFKYTRTCVHLHVRTQQIITSRHRSTLNATLDAFLVTYFEINKFFKLILQLLKVINLKIRINSMACKRGKKRWTRKNIFRIKVDICTCLWNRNRKIYKELNAKMYARRN